MFAARRRNKGRNAQKSMILLWQKQLLQPHSSVTNSRRKGQNFSAQESFLNISKIITHKLNVFS